ncbi:MAG: hypothetical protein MK096_15020 [Oleiphilaceae bacterium]|nr:hypothetical protein [Oleiphilaceae bacterium]
MLRKLLIVCILTQAIPLAVVNATIIIPEDERSIWEKIKDLDALDLKDLGFWSDVANYATEAAFKNRDKLNKLDRIAIDLFYSEDGAEGTHIWNAAYLESMLSTLSATVQYNKYNVSPTIVSYPYSLSGQDVLNTMEDFSLMKYYGKPYFESEKRGFDSSSPVFNENDLNASIRYSENFQTVLLSWNRKVIATPCPIPAASSYEFSFGVSANLGPGGDVFSGTYSYDYNPRDNYEALKDIFFLELHKKLV